MTEITTFYIADHQIDLSRSVVSKDGEDIQVEPKVLKVLLLLAQRQNEVVTHKEIMEHVWQGTEVVPNALQRCIAILRKVLNDDAKSPTVIATHPRIGYRLLADVSWEKQPQATVFETEPQSVVMEDNPKRLGVAVSVLAFAFVLLIAKAIYSTVWPDSVPNQYTRVNKLTQTDAHESHATFNPNAEYLVFNRYAGSCKTHLWAKHLKSGQESQLTKTAGNFGEASFTQDGRELVFAANSECNDSEKKDYTPVGKQECWSVATLDFAHALSKPQEPNLRYQCQAEMVQTPKALPNHQYAFLQIQNEQHQLVTYDDLSKEVKPVYSAIEEEIYHFDYEPKSKQYVVFSRNKAFDNRLKIIDETGTVLREESIELTPDMSQYQKIRGNFGPNNECLLAVADSKLYRVDYDGKLHTIITPEVNLISAMRHPYSKELVAVEGGKDVDIALIKIGETMGDPAVEDLNRLHLPFKSFSRTKKKERDAQFQPNGESIAFISNRTGRDQIWLWQDGRAQQLEFATKHYAIRDFKWSQDGTQLAIITADKLTIIDLDGKTKTLAANKPLYSIMAWYADDQFLVSLYDSGSIKLFRLDATSSELTPLGIKDVENAWVVDDLLFYRNSEQKIYQRLLTKTGKGKELPIPESRSMVLKNGYIYSVDDQTLMLNKYDLQGQFIKAVMQLKHNAWVVTDIRNDHMLLSQFVAINHDIVLLK